MKEWKELKLGQLIEIKYGKDHKRLNNGNIPCLGSGGVMRYVDDYLYSGESILIPRKGTLNNVVFQNNPFWTVDTMFWSKIHSRIVFPKFLFYQVTLIDFLNLNVGSAVPSLTIPVINDIDILLPPLPEQKAIAQVLSSLDDKIELLNEQNKTLEQMAETLFRQWFVEEAEEDWEEQPLSAFGKIVCGKTPSKKVEGYFGGDIPFVKIPDMHNNTFIMKTLDSLTVEGKNSQENKTLPSDSIMVSCIATVGLVSMNFKESQTNQQINSLIPSKDTYRYFLYCFLKQSRQLLKALASGGTATLNLNTSNFSKIAVRYPSEDSIECFSKMVASYFKKIKSNQSQIQTLTSLRDTLLPKLMSGELRVDMN